MNESMRELGQQMIAAGYDRIRVLDATGDALAETVELIDELQAQLAGLKLHVIAEAIAGGSAAVVDRVQGSVRDTPAAGRALIRLARDLGDRYRLVGQCLCDGGLSPAQASAIAAGLRQLPAPVTCGELEECQQTLLGYVDELDPDQLRRLAAHLFEVLAPEAAEALEAARLERQARQARAGRAFRLRPDHHGSMILSGQLPVADAALIQAQLEALMPSKASYAETGEAPGVDARRADALMLLAAHAAAAATLPAKGGDRPHVHVTVPLSFLTDGVGHAHLIGPDQEPLSPGEARRMACDAGVIPTVLGSASVLLDLGREQRLVPAEVRAALALRDQGCVFPSCSATPASCDAHHIQPWWAGGATSLGNTMLLCPFHHRLIEPDPEQSQESQWVGFLDPVTGRAWFIPPTHIDPHRVPRQHRRYRVTDILDDLTNTGPTDPTSPVKNTTNATEAMQAAGVGPWPMPPGPQPTGKADRPPATTTTASPAPADDDPWPPHGLEPAPPTRGRPARPPSTEPINDDPWHPHDLKPAPPTPGHPAPPPSTEPINDDPWYPYGLEPAPPTRGRPARPPSTEPINDDPWHPYGLEPAPPTPGHPAPPPSTEPINDDPWYPYGWKSAQPRAG